MRGSVRLVRGERGQAAQDVRVDQPVLQPVLAVGRWHSAPGPRRSPRRRAAWCRQRLPVKRWPPLPAIEDARGQAMKLCSGKLEAEVEALLGMAGHWVSRDQGQGNRSHAGGPGSPGTHHLEVWAWGSGAVTCPPGVCHWAGPGRSRRCQAV